MAQWKQAVREGADERLNWLVLVLAGLVLAIWCSLVPGGFSITGFVAPGCGVVGAMALGLFYRHVRPSPNLAATLIALAQLIAFPMIGAPLSYLVAMQGGVLWDTTFVAWDKALGFEWGAYCDWVRARPPLSLGLSLSYASLLVQMIVTVVVVGFTGHVAALRRFVFAMMVAALVAILISGAMPAFTMFEFLRIPHENHPSAISQSYIETLQGLRAGTLRAIDLGRTEGIIAFPSYHASLAVIFARALWSVRWVRWPGLLVNLGMLAATPIDGGHYLCDVVAGVAIGMAALALAERRIPWPRIASGRTDDDRSALPGMATLRS